MKGIIFDLDGTLVRGDDPVPGAATAVQELRRRGIRIAYCTQDSINPPALVAEKLDRLGFTAAPADVVSAGWVAAAHIAERYRHDPVFMIGAPELRRFLFDNGINLVPAADAKAARVVFVARDPDFSAEHFTAACQAIWNGADFFGSGYDRILPLAGRHAPGVGAVIKAIEHVTGRRAYILGKPSLELAQSALRRLRAEPREAIVVGDQVDSDIRMGKSAGCHTVLVLTGGTTAAAARRIPERWRPNAILTDVGLLPEWLERTGRSP